jgi:hypothetical protein
MRDTYDEYQRPECVVMIPAGREHSGRWRGEVPARLVDGQGDWSGEVQWRDHVHEAYIAAVPVAGLTDGGVVSPAPVE